MPQLLSIVALCPVVTGASLAEDEGLCRKADRKDQHGVCGTGTQVGKGGAGHIAAGRSRCSTHRCVELKVEVIVGAGGVLLAEMACQNLAPIWLPHWGPGERCMRAGASWAGGRARREHGLMAD